MTTKKPKRVRKPNLMKLGFFYPNNFVIYPAIRIHGIYVNLKQAKKLHSWLSKAIAYLEQKEGMR